jgi:hypothetical protein
MAGTFTITGMAAGLPTGEKIIGPISATGNTTIGTIVDVQLASGDNTFAIPSQAVSVLIVFPQSMTQTIKARTNLDTGGCTIAPQSAAYFACLPLPTGATSLILNASGAVILTTEITFI